MKQEVIGMKSSIVSVFISLSFTAIAAAPIITDVTANQRNPWNGKIDISYMMTGDILPTEYEDGLLIELKVSAADRMTGSNYVANASALSGDMGLGAGVHKLYWDMSKEDFSFKSSNVVFTVSYEAIPALYCVVDLSGGPTAPSYPITYLNEPPSGGFNTDEYKTSKLVLRRIDPGSYVMGCTESEVGYNGNEVMPHMVTIGKPFYIGVFEVTQRQFELVTGSKPSYYNNSECYAMRPVEQLTWNDIRGDSSVYDWPLSSSVDPSSFMGKLRSKTGIDTFDLPTEAKWEYACRAKTITAINSGKNLVNTSSDVNMDEVGRYYYSGGYLYEAGSYKKPPQSCATVNGTAEVGSYLPNSWGLYDMHGNVYEWCLDWYQGRDSFPSLEVVDPVGPMSGSDRVRRGGSCWDVAKYCRSAYRSGITPTARHGNDGFRLSSTMECGEICKAEAISAEIDLCTNLGFNEATLRTEDNSATNLVAVCTNDCRVTFKWKCSCEPLFKGNPYDYLSFSIDGVQQAFICGETDWTEQSYTVSGAGGHAFTWTYQKDAQDAAGEDCGWVKQVIVAPLVTLLFNGGEADSGTPPAAMSFYADDDAAVLPGCGTLALVKHSFEGWSDGETVYAAGTACPYLKTAQTLTAVWAINTLSAPVITAPATYEAGSVTVTITADEGADIYYTLDGAMPSAAATLYTMPFDVQGSATIRAIAVRDNYFDSEVVEFDVTRLTWTFGEYLNCPERSFTTGGDAEWVRTKGASSDGFALRSGAVEHSQTSWLETVVYGSGTVRFLCKVDGEIVKKLVYDGLAFCVDGVRQGDLIGDADWAEKVFAVVGDGRHVLGWCYVKDEDGGGGGEDCAWLDCVSWTADDPLPALDVPATDNDAKAIVAGLSDVRLSEKIVGKTAYSTFRVWVDGNVLSHVVVRDAPNAWLSYALDAPGLMAKAVPIASEDVVIEAIEPSNATSGAFDLVVDVAGEEIGEGAQLAEVLGVEGAAELKEPTFSSEGVSVTLLRTADGKVKAIVAPDGTPPAFFLRVKVK